MNSSIAELQTTFLADPHGVLSRIIFGHDLGTASDPDEELSDRMTRCFVEAKVETRTLLEETLFRWLDDATKQPSPHRRDYFAYILAEILNAATELRLWRLAKHLSANVFSWAAWFEQHGHGTEGDPLVALCRCLSESSADNSTPPKFRPSTVTLRPFWRSTIRFEGHHSAICSDIAAKTLIRDLVSDSPHELPRISVEHALALLRYAGDSRRDQWCSIWIAAFLSSNLVEAEWGRSLDDCFPGRTPTRPLSNWIAAFFTEKLPKAKSDLQQTINQKQEPGDTIVEPPPGTFTTTPVHTVVSTQQNTQ